VLDFGEIGDVTTQQVQSSPDRYMTAANNTLRVRSSGPFEVRVRSQNDFRLTFPGGNTGNAAESIRYSVRFLGQDIASNAAFGTRTCARAGVAGATGQLPIRAKLTEGGTGKAPSSSYGDTVTITFTPIVAASAAQQCGGM
jgi:spore coat protein U-like protein